MTSPHEVGDEDGLHDAPWYVRAFVRVGMPTAFAALLLWFLVTNVNGIMTSISATQSDLLKVNVTVISNQQQIMNLLAQNAREQRDTHGVLLALCYNHATTPTDVARCNDALAQRP